MKEKIILNWSGGKDSALSLYKILRAQEYDVMCLLTNISEKYRRISMHGVREELLETQVDSIGLPLVKMNISSIPTMENYEITMQRTLTQLQDKGATASAYGDIFLQDLRDYRERKLHEIQMKGIFPLWNMPTDRLIREFLDLGFRAITTCVNEKCLDKSFVGRIIDCDFLKDLPKNVDPCGEKGGFHSFVFDGPIFTKSIPFEKGEIMYRKYTSAKQKEGDSDCFLDKDDEENSFDTGFWYCDLLLPQVEAVDGMLITDE